MAWRWLPIGAAIVGLPLGGFWLLDLGVYWAVTGRLRLPYGLGEVIGAVAWFLVGLTFTIVLAYGQRVEGSRNLAACDHPQDRQTTQAPERPSSLSSSPDSEK